MAQIPLLLGEAVEELRIALGSGVSMHMSAATARSGPWAEGGAARERAIKHGFWPEDNAEVEENE